MASGDGERRTNPNILVTGTPGTGKTTMSSRVADATGFRHIDVSELVRSKNLHDGWDDEYGCHIINEDLVCDELEDMMEVGGNIVDYHDCDFFPASWFDLVVVLQTDISILYNRLISRGYRGLNLSSNIHCQLFLVLLEEANSSYGENKVFPLRSDSEEDTSWNVTTLIQWVNNWRPPRP